MPDETVETAPVPTVEQSADSAPAPVAPAPPMPPDGFVVVTETPKPPDGIPSTFDFRVVESAMDPYTQLAYRLVRRKAKLANNGFGDPAFMKPVDPEKPDGPKVLDFDIVMTRAEVEKYLGTTIEQAKIASKCC